MQTNTSSTPISPEIAKRTLEGYAKLPDRAKAWALIYAQGLADGMGLAGDSNNQADQTA